MFNDLHGGAFVHCHFASLQYRVLFLASGPLLANLAWIQRVTKEAHQTSELNSRMAIGNPCFGNYILLLKDLKQQMCFFKA